MCSTSFARETLNSGVFPFTYSQNLPYGATHPVNSFPEPRPTPERVLYIAVGTLRGGKEAWCRMAAALPPGAEVILFMGDPDPENTKVFRECCGENYTTVSDHHSVPLSLPFDQPSPPSNPMRSAMMQCARARGADCILVVVWDV